MTTQDNGARAAVEAAWFALGREFVFTGPHDRVTAHAIVAEHRPRIEAALRLPDAAELDRLRAALKTIRNRYGVVCDDFELCRHAACQSSYSAWQVATAALAEPEGSAGTSPHELWERSNGDRVEYLRLMREHGHIVPGKRPPGEDIFGHRAAEGSARDGG